MAKSEAITFLELQQRMKWSRKSNNPLSEGDFIVIQEKNLHSLQWAMGRIVQRYPGKDGLVRVVSVNTKSGVVKRVVLRLCVLYHETICLILCRCKNIFHIS